MMILAIYSNKGGVGKTATAVNLSYLAAQSGLKTLLCDLDAQASSTYYLRVKPKLKRQARGLTKNTGAIERSIKGSDYENLDLLPADFSHRNLDIVFDRLKHSTERLSKVFQPLRDEYDLIILDCLSSINILAENVFNAADVLLTPMIPTTLSLRTFKQMLTFLEDTHKDTQRVYTFFSMVDRRKRLHLDTMELVRSAYPNVLRSDIPYLSFVERMGIERQPVPAFAPNSKAAQAYIRLWSEIHPILFNHNPAYWIAGK
jgi:chromosome partitioning protein